MKTSKSARVRVTRVAGSMIVVAGLLLALAASAQIGPPPSKGQPPAPTPPPGSTKPPMTREEWQKAMTRIPHPKKGCFKATYPSLEWQEVPCVAPPNRPYPPSPWPTPQNLGGTNGDFSAQVTNVISSAVGSFDSVGGLTSETDSGTGTSNTYSLQLNTNFFSGSPACSTNPGCLGWQQFVYAVSPVSQVFMQYWLIRYNTTCPVGWNTYTPPMSTDIYCWRNSSGGTAVPLQPLTNFGNLNLTGTASNGGLDAVSMSLGGTTYATSDNDNIVTLAPAWQTAEFNVFGDGNSSRANFNTGSHVIVRTTVNSGTMNAPSSLTQSFTAETNNFTLVPPSCPYGGANPAVVFDESTNAGATSMCANGTSIGDTHLTNINGVLYDFQSTGDFLLAETDPDFVIQTRQVSGAPNWPNASVNKAVAMKLGKTRFGLCLDPNRFVVDGKPGELGDGKTLSLPGVFVTRSGNTYIFTRPNGENVRVELNNGWINVSVGLGQMPVARVNGLIGNANGNTGQYDIATRNGTMLKQPVSFADLYQRYADSWRVPANESLLSVCGEGKVEPGLPKRPFYANDLDPKVYERTRAVCTAAGVKVASLLEACALDVAVIGRETAAKAFVGARVPIAVIKPGSRQQQ